MTKIFISYRRKDDPYAARGVNDALCKRFGKRNVYFDLEAIQAGLDFRKQIDDMVAQCDVMLVVIGDKWLQLDESDHSRIEDDDDLVSLEVSSALKRDIPVIPVLVGSASIPAKEMLPEPIQSLIYRQAVEVRATANFNAQIEDLIRNIKLVSPPKRSGLETKAFAIASIAVLVAIGWLSWQPFMDWTSKREVTNTSVVDAEQSDTEQTLNEDQAADTPEPKQKGSTTLSQGHFPMPNVIGLTITEAQKRVLSAGQNVGTASAMGVAIAGHKDARPAGVIIKQAESPGTPISPNLDNGEVTFIVEVSQGPLALDTAETQRVESNQLVKSQSLLPAKCSRTATNALRW